METKGRWYGNTLLTITAVIWGLAFVAQSDAMNYVGPFTFQCVRCILGAAALLPVLAVRLGKKRGGEDIRGGADPLRGSRRKRIISGEMAAGGMLCGLAFTTAATLQQFAMKTTDAGKAAFMTALYIVIVPVLGIFLGQRVKARIWGCVLLCITGVWFISISGHSGIEPPDILLLLCAVIFAVQILLVNHFVKRMDGVWISFAQLITSVLLTAGPMLLLERPDLGMILDARYSILYAGVMSCGIAYTLQILGQKYTSPTAAGLIMSMECVFGMLGGVVILGQIPTGREVTGCVLVFAAVVISQLGG